MPAPPTRLPVTRARSAPGLTSTPTPALPPMVLPRTTTSSAPMPMPLPLFPAATVPAALVPTRLRVTTTPAAPPTIPMPCSRLAATTLSSMSDALAAADHDAEGLGDRGAERPAAPARWSDRSDPVAGDRHVRPRVHLDAATGVGADDVAVDPEAVGGVDLDPAVIVAVRDGTMMSRPDR